METRRLDQTDVDVLAATLEASLDGMGILDQRGCFVYVNDALTSIHGSPPGALAGERWTTLFEDAERDRIEQAALPRLDAGASWDGHATARRSDGTPVDVHVSLARTGDGHVVLVLREREPEPEDEGSVVRQRLEHLVEQASVVLFELAPDGRITLSRGRALDSLGLDPGDVVGENLFDLYPDHEPIRTAARRALDGDTVSATIEIDDLVFETQWTPVLEDGDLARVIGVATDVTDRHQAEDRMRLAVENAPVALYTLDPDGTITFAEGRALNLLGLDPEDVVGHHAMAFGDDPSQFEQDLEALARGETIRNAATLRGRRLDTRMEPVIDEHGELAQIVGIAIDVTDRHRAQADLNASRERLRAVFEASPDAILLHDLDGRIQDANTRATELLGYDPAELANLSLQDLLTLEEIPAGERALNELLGPGEVNFETTLRARDGDHVPARIRAHRLNVGSTPLVQTLIEDLTEQERTEASLRRLVEELEVSEGELRSLVDAIPDLVFVLDQQGRFVDAPETGPAVTDAPPTELLEQRIDDVLLGESGARARQAMQTALMEDELVRVEYTLESDGDPCHFEARFVPMPGARVLMVARDITDRKEAEAGLERAHRRLLTFIDHLDEGIVVEDADRRILHANEGFVETFGLEVGPMDLVGQGGPAMAEEAARLFEEPARFLALVETLPPDGVPVEGIELELVDGRVLNLDYIPIDLDQAATAHLWRYLDVTERARAKEERQAAQEQFEVAVGNLARSLGGAQDTKAIARRLAHAARVVTGAAATVVLTPDKVLASQTTASRDRSDLLELVRASPERFTWFDASLEETQTPIDLLVLAPDEGELTQPDQRKVEILSTQAAISFHRAEVAEDIRRAHDRLERSARQKQMFLDILSHDLKNPLAVATGRVDLLEMRHPELAEDLETVKRSLDRADRLIERTLLYSRLEEQQALDRQPRNLQDLVHQAAGNVEPTAEEKGVTVEIDGPEEAPGRVHPVLVQAIENLIGNAIKWSPSGGEVEVELVPMDDAQRIRVIDHGPGIPIEDRDRLFERFSRVDRTGTKGTGLGLAIAKRVVEMHDGRIWHEPTPGGGATFVLEVPAPDADA